MITQSRIFNHCSPHRHARVTWPSPRTVQLSLSSMCKVKQLDNRRANFYVSLYWAEELAAKDPAWAPLAEALAANEEQIVKVILK